MHVEPWNASTHVPNLLQWAGKDEGITQLLGHAITDEVVHSTMPYREVVVSEAGEMMAIIGFNLYGTGLATMHVIPAPEHRKMKTLDDVFSLLTEKAKEAGAKVGFLVLSTTDRAMQEIARRHGYNTVPTVQMVKVF
ncbi:hypothetical protein LCGC14_3076090 [marine sediment metagenome]|uniref:N-acetyltransferase domain-containing protein n=1 Tax=marine sediment metagenome TaxID=412755 RepID=A0A0F8YM69_9ZZZZ